MGNKEIQNFIMVGAKPNTHMFSQNRETLTKINKKRPISSLYSNCKISDKYWKANGSATRKNGTIFKVLD